MNSCASSIPVDASWYQGIIQIDGQAVDWNGLWVVPEGSPLAFATKNHDETLYLAIKSSNPWMIQHATQAGFEILIDRKGKQRPRYTLRHDGEIPEVRHVPSLNPEQREKVAEAQRMRILNGVIKLKSYDAHGRQLPINFKGLGMGRYKDGEWFCEFSIPLTALKVPPKSGDTIGVGVHIMDGPVAGLRTFQAPLGAGQPIWFTVKLASSPSKN
ncbi:MAG: hypothetical protein K9M49_02795 [Candidatus Marinimicrobia bacterium]|nr:hypothetical protein [Candidatus Neomarinimicrobiota bacterium]MCF7851145.1 hypothetical protein [Candidatus Neomarinimicrobiota bacterium]MCF7904062.1 hypothetical protein [Candidatus Neomarinimicrobiota bacterium]